MEYLLLLLNEGLDIKIQDDNGYIIFSKENNVYYIQKNDEFKVKINKKDVEDILSIYMENH